MLPKLLYSKKKDGTKIVLPQKQNFKWYIYIYISVKSNTNLLIKRKLTKKAQIYCVLAKPTKRHCTVKRV